jgi:integrase
MTTSKNPNHPPSGCQIIIEPLRTLAEVALIKEYLARNPRNLALFSLGLNACLRAGDLLQLRNSDIDWERCELRITQEKNDHKSHIALSKGTMSLLKAIRTDVENDYLFRSKKGGCMTVPALNKLVKKWTDDVGIETMYSFGSHTLKKSFIYLHWKFHKTPIEVLSKMAGHKDVATTYHYIGIIPEQIRDIYLMEI